MSDDWKLLNTSTASGAANVEFTDLTGYKIFKFVFIDVNPATNGANLVFDCSVSSSYGTTKTTTFFWAKHLENDSSAGLEYVASYDLAQSTSNQILCGGIGNGADECAAGELLLFNPTSTTYVKHFYSTSNQFEYGGYSINNYVAGYFNTTSALDKCKMLMSSGNFDGVIKQYGLVAS
jgi:hypothetical protein